MNPSLMIHKYSRIYQSYKLFSLKKVLSFLNTDKICSVLHMAFFLSNSIDTMIIKIIPFEWSDILYLIRNEIQKFF